MSGGLSLKELVKGAQNGTTPVIKDSEQIELNENSSKIIEPINEVQSVEKPDKKSNINQDSKTSSKSRKEGKQSKSVSKSDTIVNKINSLKKLDRSAQMIHVRITPETHKQLLFYQLGEDKLSIQSIVNYAIVSMLEDKEMKELLTSIKNGMV